MDVVGALRLQARACAEHGSPMYADLLSAAADDTEAGGPVAQVLSTYDGADPVADALALRLMGSMHRLVLARRAGELAAFYPSVGGTWHPTGWDAFRGLVADQPAEVAAWLDRPPQTNEVGRAAALYGALLHLRGALPVRLVEIGASGGLNLRADHFCYVDATGAQFGDPASRVRLERAWSGRGLDPSRCPEVVERRGCDLRPVDVSTPEGRLALTAYVWADMRPRLERLRQGFEIAARVPVDVRRQGAGDLLDTLELVEGVVTVVWHSVVWQYLPAAEQSAVASRIADLGAQATASRGLAHVAVEPVRRDPDPVFEVSVQQWPAGDLRVVGTSVPHGVPTTWT